MDGTGTLGLYPRASHPTVTSDARQSGHGPSSTGPELHHRHSRPSYLRVHSLRATSCRNFWCLLVTVVPFLVGVLATPNTYPTAGFRRGTATQVPRDQGQPRRHASAHR